MKLAIRAATTAVVGMIVLGIFIFLPAGTIDFWQGWAFIAVFAISTNIIGVYLALKDPALLERRMKVGPGAETRPAQKVLIALAAVGLLGLLVVSALDHRFGWSNVPAWVCVLGNLLVAAGLMIDLLVFRENSYGASTIETMAGQTVISTGPYALVRHPMYAGVLIMLIGVPLALGSWWGVGFMALNVPLLVLRILDEEAMLEEELEGYGAYVRRVGWRLVPGVW
jgi:protein-S-isoprenylcysteine O-methyltransferase Ste14